MSAPESGYLQFVRHETSSRMAIRTTQSSGWTIDPGTSSSRGHPLATVWPADAARRSSAALRRAHVAGPIRTLTQDLAFAVDQLVEIAIRALSPAVNDTFTALTCIDWLGESLCRVTRRWRRSASIATATATYASITAHVSYNAWSSGHSRRSVKPGEACRRS